MLRKIALLFLTISLAITMGCGEDDTNKPEEESDVVIMGSIDRPVGQNYSDALIILVKILNPDPMNYNFEILDVSDAVVTVNTDTLDFYLYANQIPSFRKTHLYTPAGQTVTIKAVTTEYGIKTKTLTMPQNFQIISPTEWTNYNVGDVVNVVWEAAPGANGYKISVYNYDSQVFHFENTYYNHLNATGRILSDSLSTGLTNAVVSVRAFSGSYFNLFRIDVNTGLECSVTDQIYITVNY